MTLQRHSMPLLVKNYPKFKWIAMVVLTRTI
jgi:hypothetical protein